MIVARICKLVTSKIVLKGLGNFPVYKIHIGVQLSEKVFYENENKYAFDIIKSKYKHTRGLLLQKYDDTKLWDNLCDNGNLASVQNFVYVISNNTGESISQEKYNNFVNQFVNICSDLTPLQLSECIKCLKSVSGAPSLNSPNFVELWSAIDDSCIKCLPEMSIQELFLLCDFWYDSNIGRSSYFVWEAIHKLGQQTDNMVSSELVHLAFHCNILRKPVINMSKFEKRFSEIMHTLTIDDIAVICMAFFKTATSIKNPHLVKRLYLRLISEIKSVQDIPLVTVLKLLRLSTKPNQDFLMSNLLETICLQIPRFSLLSCLHIALLGTGIQLCHERCVNLIISRFNKDIEKLRLKDMERICHVLGLFSISTQNSSKLCVKILSNIKDKASEILRHPNCFLSCLHFLTLCGFYDHQLLNFALHPDFVHRTYFSHASLGRDALFLNSFVEINLSPTCEENEESLWSKKCINIFKNGITKNYLKEKLTATDRILLEIKEICEKIFGVCFLKNLLPHFERPDIVFGYDNILQKSVVLNADFMKRKNSTFVTRKQILDKFANNDHILICVLVVAGRNNYVRNTSTLTGILNYKIHQLKILGHTPLTIPWYEWSNLETREARNNFIRRKLLSIL